MATVSEAMKALQKMYGKDVLFFARDDGGKLLIPRLSTGCLPIDLATGGGLPRNRVSLLYGDESCGKTLLSLYAVIDAQSKDPNTFQLFIDAEGSFDPTWAVHLGVDMDRVIYARPENLEMAFDVLIGMISDSTVDVIVLDSIASQAPIVEIEGAMDNARVGVVAIQVNKALRKIQSAMNTAQHRPAIILINQIRNAIGAYGDPTVLTGGMGQRFFSSLQIALRKSSKEYDKDDKDILAYQTVHWTIAKSKISIPGRKGKYDLTIAGENSGEIVVLDALMGKLKEMGLLEQAGAWYTLKVGDTEERYQGKNALLEVVDKLEAVIIEEAKRKGVLPDEYRLTKMASRSRGASKKAGDKAREAVS